MNKFLDAALEYAKRGYPVIPLNGKVPAIPKSAGGNGINDATTDPIVINAWWQQYPNANIGLATGSVSGLIVVDVDRGDGKSGEATLAALEQKLGRLPKTCCQISGNGFHLFFKSEDRQVRNRTNFFGPGVDIRGDGGYIVVAPSIHPDTKTPYSWYQNYGLLEFEPALAPNQLVELVNGVEKRPENPAAKSVATEPLPTPGSIGQGYGTTALLDECAKVLAAPDGAQEETLNNAALKIGGLVAGGEILRAFAERELIAAGMAMTNHKASAPWTKQMVTKKVQHGLDDGAKEPRKAPNSGSEIFNSNSSVSSNSGGNENPAELPQPLVRELPPAGAFPIDALGPILQNAALGIQDQIQAPLAICGQTVLAAANLAVQGHADIELPSGQVKPISCIFVSVAGTGERKSAADSVALRPIRKREAVMRDVYDTEYPQWEDDHAIWERARTTIVNSKKDDGSSKRQKLKDLGQAPERPLLPLLSCEEPTFEGLCRLFPDALPSLGVFSAEGGQFIGGHGMNKDNRLKTSAALSTLWDGETLKRVRAGDAFAVYPGRRVAMHLMLQPGVADELLSDHFLADQGLLSRVLVTAPDSTSGSRFWREPGPEGDAAIRAYYGRMMNILEVPLPLAEEKRNQLAPLILKFSNDAREMWIEFVNHVEARIGPGGELEPAKGLANKLPEHAARLAATICLVDDIGAAALSADHMAAGIKLAQHYAAEALRLFENGQISAELKQAEKLLHWLVNVWPEEFISLPDIYQKGPSGIRDRQTAIQMAGVLQNHGHLRKVPNGAEVQGQKRRDAWQIVRP